MTDSRGRAPKVFIGCSSESLLVAQVLKAGLEPQASVTLWTDPSIFRPAQFYVDSLLQIPELFDFGVFLFEPDDLVESRGKTQRTPRDNTIFELGLFMSRLGLRRALAVMPRGAVKVLSDISGLKPFEYDAPSEFEILRQGIFDATNPTIRKSLEERLRAELKMAMAPVIQDLRRVIEAGPLKATGAFADAPNVVQAAPTLRRLLKAVQRTTHHIVVRNLALDMAEAWGIISNDYLHGSEKLFNVTWQCLMINPQSFIIQQADSPSVSVQMAATRIVDMQRFLKEKSQELRARNVVFECRLYDELPQMHGFHIEGGALLWSLCDIQMGKLDALNNPYWRFEAADEELSSFTTATAFKNHFDHKWANSHPAWEKL